VKIDFVELEKLCGLQCTDEEIAAFLDVSTRTIERRRRVLRIREVMERGRAKGRVSVRGNIAAIIFLAKNVLGYKDYVNNEHSGPNGGPIQIESKPDFSKLSHEELQQLRLLVGKAKSPKGA
jgi:hypothetical protein